MNKDKKIAIIGSGALATSLANVLYDSNCKNVIIWGIDDVELNDLRIGKNKKYFPDVSLPKFQTTKKLDYALENVDFIIIAVPSLVMDNVYRQILSLLKSNALVVNGSKGFYPNTNRSIHAGLTNASKGNKFIKGIVSLIGPSHAEEIVIRMNTMVSAVSKNIENATIVKNLFTNSYFKVSIETGVRGAEICAAYKNVLAIASGIIDGLGYGINTKAAFLTLGISEMKFYLKKVKGNVNSILSLTGIGDLIVTTMSNFSRNFTFGKEFAQDRNLALKSKKTIEGLFALKAIKSIADRKKINLEIINILYQIIYEERNPNELIKELWN